MATAELTQLEHATTVAWNGHAVVIMGASGSGKSGLGLTLMGLGATLVADDQTQLMRQQDSIIASAPDTLRGMIEARYVGILNAEVTTIAKVVLVVDLDTPETDRLPQRREVTILGCRIPLLHCVTGPHFGSAILQILKAGRSVP